MTHRRALLLPLVLAGIALPVAARARDDEPTPAERARIEAVLRRRGFVSWGEIEREDDGRTWEVDDARHRDGHEYDLKLAAGDLREIRRERDD